MFCPHCKREVAPKRKLDFGAFLSTAMVYTIGFFGMAMVCDAGCDYEPAVIANYGFYGSSILLGLSMGFSKGWYKYCPVCFTPLTKPKTFAHSDFEDED